MKCDPTISDENYYYLIVVCGFLSACGCLYIIINYWKNPSMRGYFNKLVFYISITDLVRSLLLFFPCNKVSNWLLRQLLGAFLESTLLIAVIWSTCISITLYQVIILSVENFERFHKYWFFISFVFVPLIFLLPILTDSYESEFSICIFSNDNKGFLFRIVIVYVPEVILIVLSIYAYTTVYFSLKDLSITWEKKNLVKKLMLYPFVMVVDIVPTIISRTLQWFGGVCGISIMIVGSMLIFSLHGFFNAWILYFSNSISKEIRKNKNPSYASINFSDGSDQANLLIESIFEPMK